MKHEKPETKSETLADSIFDVLCSNILADRLPAGTILRESELARFFETSREPVSRAIRSLESKGLINKRDRQGYIVGGAANIERSLNAKSIIIPAAHAPVFDGIPIWKKVYHDVETELLRFLPFGRFKIVESALASHFSVSRNVIQQVVSRLCERGIAEKNSRSNCNSILYDTNFVRHCYELRIALEPTALCLAVPFLTEREVLRNLSSHKQLSDGTTKITSERLVDLEWQFHSHLLQACPNPRILSALRASQISHSITTGMVHNFIGTKTEQLVSTEHIAVLLHLLDGETELAAQALRSHLKQSLVRSCDRVPTLSKGAMPELPSFLKKIH